MFNLKKMSLLAILLLLISCGKKEYSTNKLIAISLYHSEKGEWDKSNFFIIKALKKEPENVDALIMSSITSENTNNINDAIDSLLIAVKISPDNFFIQYNLGRLLYRKELFETAIPYLKSAEQIQSTNDVKLLLAEINQKLGLHKKAITYFTALLKTEEYKNSPILYNELGVLWTKTGDTKRGAQYLGKALQLNKNNHITNLNFAILCEKHLNNSKFAKIYYMKTLELIKNNINLNSKYKQIQEKISDI